MGRPKRPTSDDIAKMLSEAAPMSAPKEPPVPQAPLEAMPVKVDILEIDPYEGNPRRLPNPQYEAIKESIRQKGLQQPLVITRRPGSARWVVARGGNTRLKALRELWEETKDERFRRVDAHAVPWEGEAELLAAHLRENDLRGNLTLLERALAVRQLRELIEKEQERKLSQRELVEALKTRGYSIPRPRLVVYDYVVDVLHQAVPQALEAGMGRPQVEALRALEDAFRKVWEHLSLGDREIARSFFQEVLARHDAPRLDLEAIARALASELAMGADDWSDDDVWLLFQAAREGRDLSSVVLPGRVPQAEDGTPSGEGDEDAQGLVEVRTHRRRRTGGETPRGAEAAAADGAPGGGTEAAAAPPSAGGSGAPSAGAPAAELPAWLDQDLEPPPWADVDFAQAWWRRLAEEVRGMLGPTAGGRRARLPDDIGKLRQLAYRLAMLLNYETGTRSQIDVVSCPCGNGYLVGPMAIPIEFDLTGEEEKEPETPEELEAQMRELMGGIARVACWHVLLSLSGQFLPGAPANVFAPQMWMNSACRKDGRLRAMLEMMARNHVRGDPMWAEDAEMEEHVRTQMLKALHPMTFVAGMSAWVASLGPRAYGYLLTLVDVVRKIHALSGGNPWFDVEERCEELRRQLEESGLLERARSSSARERLAESTDWKPRI